MRHSPVSDADWNPGEELDWRSYALGTRNRYVVRYADYAQQNTHNYTHLEEELANLLNAAQQAYDQRFYDQLLQMVEWLWSSGGQFLDLRADAPVGIQLLAQAVEAARALGDKRQEEHALGQLGRAQKAAGDSSTALESFTQALMIAQETGDRQGEASHLGNIGLIFWEQRKLDKATARFEKAINNARELGDRQLEGRLLGSLGLVKLQEGTAQSLSEAIKHLQGAIEIARETGDRRGEASHLGSIGVAHEQIGRNGFSLPPFVSGPYPAEDADRYERYHQDLEQANRKMYYKAYRYYEEALGIAGEIRDQSMQETLRADRLRVVRLGGFPTTSDGGINWNIWMRNPPLVALSQDE